MIKKRHRKRRTQIRNGVKAYIVICTLLLAVLLGIHLSSQRRYGDMLTLGEGRALGIDVSEWNGDIDWNAVKDSGIEFAIIRCGYGKNGKDKFWEKNAKACCDAGIPFGVYIYSQARTREDAHDEAKHALKLIRHYNFGLPVYYDVETDTQQGMIPSELTGICEEFCETVKSAGYNVGVYANAWFYSNLLTGEYFENGNVDKWVADYDAFGVDGFEMWQYSESGTVSGITGAVDMNCRKP